MYCVDPYGDVFKWSIMQEIFVGQAEQSSTVQHATTLYQNVAHNVIKREMDASDYNPDIAAYPYTCQQT